MPKVRVIGLGPGHKDYILPVCSRVINSADVVIGAPRNLASLGLNNQQVIAIGKNLTAIKGFILANKQDQKIAVVVSGDTGFYSLLVFLKGFLMDSELDVYPGISSMQYLFARIKKSYQNAVLTSLHGRDNDILTLVKNNKMVAVLTDKVNTPSAIARLLLKNKLVSYSMIIGENLSYDNEKILQLPLKKAALYKTTELNTIIICKETELC